MDLAPITGRHSLPTAKGTTKGVRVFEAKQIGCLVQFQYGVRQVITRHLMSGLVEDPLKTVARILQAALYRSRTQVKRLSDNFDGWPMSSQPVLNGSTHKFNEIVFRRIFLSQSS